MVFSKKEFDLLDAAYQTFIGRIHVFNVLSEKTWSSAGIENWVQTEFIVALIDRGHEVTTKDKVKRGCDIIVQQEKSGLEVRIELGATTSTYHKSLTNRIERHPNADLYLFLSKVNANMLEKLHEYFKQHGYVEEHRMLNGWMVMLVKKD